MPTTLQDDWVFDTFAVHPASFKNAPSAKPATTGRPSGPATATAKAPAPAPAAASSAPTAATGSPDSVKSLIPSLPSLPDVPDPVITATITISNKSALTLELVSTHLENPNGSGFDDPPSDQIVKDDGPVDAIVSNNFPFATGVGGSVTYKIVGDDQNTVLFMQWDRGRVPKRAVKAEVRPANTSKYHLHGGFNGDHFTFVFKSADSPNPNPKPADAVNTSCSITITNNTQSVLTLAHQGHDQGDFASFPASTLQPGANTSCVSAKTANAKPDEQGCKGFLVWEAAGATAGTAAVTWRVDWDNPVGEKNTATATLDPQSAGFASLEQVGQGDEKVPVAFTLSGGPQPGVTPVTPVDPVDPVTPVDPVNPSAPSDKDPTLRMGDSSADGWVEYLQQVLSAQLGGPPLATTGKFDKATHDAVIAFQTKNHLQVDGVVGNQTWAALRMKPKEDVGTDGRQPHTFVDTGAKARWFFEKFPAFVQKDTLILSAISVGDTDIAGQKVTVTVTPPGGQPKSVVAMIGKASPSGPKNDDEGVQHDISIPNFRKTFPAPAPDAKVADYLVQGAFDAALGGDKSDQVQVLEIE